MFPDNRVLLGSPVPVQHCGPGFHSPFSVTGKLWSGSAQLGIKGRNKCEPPQSVLFIVTQDVQKSPDLNLACLFSLLRNPQQEAKFHQWGKDGLLQE